jgi:hypothetical protein
MTTKRMIAGATLLAVGVAITSAAGPARAQSDDWPCLQRLVPKLEAGQMWSGPTLEAIPDTPSPAIAALTQRFLDMHLAPEALATDVATFADALPAEQRKDALVQLFATSLDRLNSERAVLIGGIKRYARNQQRMAEKISTEIRALDALRQQPDASGARIDDLQTARDWDTRVFTDRQRELRLVCEQPVLLEQRAFALARIIQDKLP